MRSLFGALVVLLSSCATTGAASDDSRLDDASVRESSAKRGGRECGPDAPGDLILLDATTGGSVPCLPVTVTVDDADVYFRGLSGPKGQVKLLAPIQRARLVAVADGFAPSELNNASSAKDRVLELELAPAEGFWLKVLDGEGNYLQDVQLTFKQGADVIAQLRSNTLANVFFSGRQPFSGQPVTIEAAGFQSVTVSSISELGDDGHSLTLTRQ